jgi:hypothetical protein
MNIHYRRHNIEKINTFLELIQRSTQKSPRLTYNWNVDFICIVKLLRSKQPRVAVKSIYQGGDYFHIFKIYA